MQTSKKNDSPSRQVGILRGPGFAAALHDVGRALSLARPDLAITLDLAEVDRWTWQGTILFQGREDFGLRIRASRPGRLIISGLCPVEASPDRINRARITVAHTRPAAAIARDVCRRLLPKYLAAYQEADDVARRYRRHEADQRQTLAAIAGHLGQVPSRHLTDRCTRPATSAGPRIEARVSGSKICLTLYDLDLATARRLCDLADGVEAPPPTGGVSGAGRTPPDSPDSPSETQARVGRR